MRQTVTIHVSWPMGHRLQDHDGLCRGLHGHSYLARVEFEGQPLQRDGSPERGMIADFSLLKRDIMEIVGVWDHAMMLEHGDPCIRAVEQWAKVVTVAAPPTAEHISALLLTMLGRSQGTRSANGVRIASVTVYESDRTCATAEA